MALIPMALFFLIIMPALLVWSSALDQWLGMTRFTAGSFNLIIASALIAVGLVFALWSVATEFIRGGGTPAPMMPTQKLVISGPFLYCRNPMTFGTIAAYLGVAVLVGSLSSLLLVLLLAAVLVTYIKLVEEKELELRFGQDYVQYRKRVPFIIPGKKR